MGQTLSTEQEAEVMALFHKLDKNNDGTISIFELASFFSMDQRKLVEVMHEFSGDDEVESLDVGQFSSLIEARFLADFNKYDKDENGTISLDELREYYAEKNLGPQEIEKVLKRLDPDNDGNISLSEFIQGLFYVHTVQ